MHPEIEDKINELRRTLILHASPETVSFSLFINSEETQVEITTRTPAQLKDAGISMRNLRGAFIK